MTSWGQAIEYLFLGTAACVLGLHYGLWVSGDAVVGDLTAVWATWWMVRSLVEMDHLLVVPTWSTVRPTWWRIGRPGRLVVSIGYLVQTFSLPLLAVYLLEGTEAPLGLYTDPYDGWVAIVTFLMGPGGGTIDVIVLFVASMRLFFGGSLAGVPRTILKVFVVSVLVCEIGSMMGVHAPPPPSAECMAAREAQMREAVRERRLSADMPDPAECGMTWEQY